MSESLSPAAGPTFRPVPDIADALGVVVTRVHQLLRDRAVVAVRRDGVPQIPSEFFDGHDVVRGLSGTITLLTDAGYSDGEIVDWLFASDVLAAGAAASSDAAGTGRTAIGLLRAGRVKEVHRRAQIAGF